MKKLFLLLLLFPLIGFGQCVSGDCENGIGLYIDKDKDGTYIYDGEWRDWEPNGFGTEIIYDENGVHMGTYVGEFKGGEYHGWGTEILLDDDGRTVIGTHVGEWEDGTEKGWGIYIWDKDDIEKGEWEDGELIEE